MAHSKRRANQNSTATAGIFELTEDAAAANPATLLAGADEEQKGGKWIM